MYDYLLALASGLVLLTMGFAIIGYVSHHREHVYLPWVGIAVAFLGAFVVIDSSFQAIVQISIPNVLLGMGVTALLAMHVAERFLPSYALRSEAAKDIVWFMFLVFEVGAVTSTLGIWASAVRSPTQIVLMAAASIIFSLALAKISGQRVFNFEGNRRSLYMKGIPFAVLVYGVVMAFIIVAYIILTAARIPTIR